jgi:hypothetical protein
MMSLIQHSPRKSLNKSYLKVKPNRSDIEKFKTNLTQLLDQMNDKETEEFHKTLLTKFLDGTYYSPHHFVNTKGRNDLVIHNGKDANSTVGVIIETKSPTNKNEMLSSKNLNTKAMQELVWYYLQERISHKNLEVKHLIATNINEWFIFDAQVFDKAFAQDAALVKQFNEFKEGRLAGKDTNFFYKNIAEPAIAKLTAGESKAGKDIVYTHFDLRDVEKTVRNADKSDDNKLIALFKLLSPEHLLKLPFKNDSNSLDKGFYAELLHIIGLTEIKDGGKKLIDRKEDGTRNEGSILENTIHQLDVLDKLSRVDRPSQFGTTNSEKFFNLGLELVITWINRVLFLKLLEAQLISYHKGNKEYSFLNGDKIKNFDDLNSLFFSVLAKQTADRSGQVKSTFQNVPYLNSSLFEPTDLEHSCLFISQLQDDKQIPILSSTVLKDSNGKKRSGSLSALQYLFEFLDSYDFSSEGSEDIQEENKTLISASVLGLIFEKINGYKDGSFFTPGFITMYMCRETIRRAILQKFKEVKGWDCETLDQLYDKISDKREANTIINSLKICDPAVGSGHFLVSALNEIIAIKSELKVLIDREGKTLRDYTVEVTNDELTITDEDGKLFEYNPRNKESQRIQETLFHEKQAIIENCLFGVDINPNSVKICRLRLWIELLKNAYYRSDSNFTELETLPNIDINIKCGNSLVSRYPLNVDLTQALKKSKISIAQYKDAVQKYRHAENKNQKREMEQLINSIKSNFRSEISQNDPKVKKLSNKRGELNNLLNQHSLFELSKTEKKSQEKVKAELKKEVEELELEIEEIKSNKIFENSFEWRFEFPEILNDSGDFIGFDITIGNPPYGVKDTGKKYLDLVQKMFPIARRVPDSYFLFIVKGFELSRQNGYLNYIVPNTFCDIEQGSEFRFWLLSEMKLYKIFDSSWVFEDAVVDTAVMFAQKATISNYGVSVVSKNNSETVIDVQNYLSNSGHKIDYRANQESKKLLLKIEKQSSKISDVCSVKAGVKLYEKGKGTPPQDETVIKNKPYTRIGVKNSGWRPLIRGGDINSYYLKPINEFVNYGQWLAAPRDAQLFSGERIVMRRTDDVLRSTYLSDDSVCVNSCHVITPRNVSEIFAILGFLNSKLLQWIFEVKNPQMIGKTFAEIKVTYVEELPYKSIPEIDELTAFVKQLLDVNLDNEVKRGELKDQINSIIYKAYSLSQEEISLIENYK